MQQLLFCHIPITTMFKQLHANVWLLTLAQVFIAATGSMVVFVGSFVGMALSPNPAFATFPVAFMIGGVATFALPVVRVFEKIGRQKGFILAISFGALNSLFVMVTIYLDSFWLFCVGILLYGIPLVASGQFRFAAMESVSEDKAGQAVSTLLMAGLGAAFIGPEIGFWGKELLAAEYAGAFLLLSVCYVVALLPLLKFRPFSHHQKQVELPVRPLLQIIKQPLFMASLSAAAVGFAVMSFIMTATPISMHVHHAFSVQDTKWVIQSHVIAMYLPSLFTGLLIRRYGAVKLLLAGIFTYTVCIGIGLVDQAYIHYWGALVLLGIGWNFMFITATSILPKSYNESEKFRVQGVNDFAIYTSQGIASLSAGWVINSAGWQTLLWVNVPFLLAVCLFIAYWQFSERRVIYQKNA
ncbi:MFS transporter [Alteromonas sediminis]|uniref:MFS transporter n=1 Tax=Alteromonas sediminis TaxID=2259342 RepID=A0A3N5ZBD5_9ALTE|nr:MFS transporter [Alteromonas sediminis]RPJ68594.1 MFS transporter [Alteromonas sediminis]